MPRAEDFLRAGRLRLRFAEHPEVELPLASAYHGSGHCFVTVDVEPAGPGATLLATVHPKAEGLRLTAAEARWLTPGQPADTPTRRTYRRARVNADPGRPLELSSSDESTAFTHFYANDRDLRAERQYAGKQVRHSLPVLSLVLAPPEAEAEPRESEASPGHVLRLEAPFLALASNTQYELLAASLLPELGVRTGWLDLTLTLDLRRLPPNLVPLLGAFAKTCSACDLRAGVSVSPFVWTAAGVSRHVAAPTPQAKPMDDVAPRGSWDRTTGRLAHPVRSWGPTAETSLVQGMLHLRDLGFEHFDLRDLAALGHPERPVAADEAALLHRGIHLLTDAVPGATLVASDLPAEYLAPWPLTLRTPLAERPGTVASVATGAGKYGFWRKPSLPGLAPRYRGIDPALDELELWCLREIAGTPPKAGTNIARIAKVFELPLPREGEVTGRGAGASKLGPTYWRRVEVALQRQLDAWQAWSSA